MISSSSSRQSNVSFNKQNKFNFQIPSIFIGGATSASKISKYTCQEQISIKSQVKILSINVFHSNHIAYLDIYSL